MAWVIGIVIALLGIVIVRKFLRVRAQLQLIEACKQHIWFAYRMLKPFDKEFDPKAWADPYLLGYTQGYSSLLTNFAAPNLPTVDRGMIAVRTMQDLVGEDYSRVLSEIEKLSQLDDQSFLLGMEHGSNVAILMSDRAGPDLLADKEVQAALSQAPSDIAMTEAVFGKAGPSGQTSAAGGTLMRNYLSAHRESMNW